MVISHTPLHDLLVLAPKVFGDERGYFFESYNSNSFAEFGLKYSFIQDNESFSSYGTIRGLHFQRNEFSQAKLVRVIHGKVLDVVVDLRQESPTFRKAFSIELSSENKLMLLVPRGFAHGFAVLSKEAYFVYKCDNVYSPSHESGLRFDDPELNINWQLKREDIKLSDRDRKLPTLQEALRDI